MIARPVLRTVLSFAAGLFAGAAAVCVVWGMMPEEQGSAMAQTLGEEDVEWLLTRLRGWHNSSASPLLVRSNGYVAYANAKLKLEWSEKGGRQGGHMIQAAARERCACDMLYFDAEPSALIVLFRRADGRLIHYAHPVLWGGTNHILGPSVAFRPVKPAEFAERGELGKDGVIYVTNQAFEKEPALLRLPKGAEATMGFRFPDGTYTNFVPVRWLGHEKAG